MKDLIGPKTDLLAYCIVCATQQASNERKKSWAECPVPIRVVEGGGQRKNYNFTTNYFPAGCTYASMPVLSTIFGMTVSTPKFCTRQVISSVSYLEKVFSRDPHIIVTRQKCINTEQYIYTPFIT